MRIPTARWATTDRSIGTVFIAQLADELLDDVSWDSYRVYSLDLLARLSESLDVIEDIQKERIAKAAIEPVVAEIMWSLRDDPVVSTIDSFDVDFTIDTIRKRSNILNELAQNIRFIIKTLQPIYKECCEENVSSLCSSNKRRSALRSFMSSYIAHLVNIGYDRRYIQNSIDHLFFNPGIAAIDPRKITALFQRFDLVQGTYTVISKIDVSFAQAATRMKLGKILSTGEIAASYSNQFPSFFTLGKRNRFLEMKFENILDPYSARELAGRFLGAGQAMLANTAHAISTSWDDEMFVVRGRQSRGHLLDKPSLPLHRRKKVSHKAAINYAEYLAKNMFGLFSRRSSERLLRSINTSALARTSPNIENQIVSLWSAMEVLLSEPTVDVPRIVHYAGLIKPCVCLRYVRRHIVRLYDQLDEIYGRPFRNIVNKEERGAGDFYTKFAIILMAEDRRTTRQELCRLCEKNPLALHKMWRVHRWMSSPKEIKKLVESHEAKVEWQIHRIYRARNNLVHTGREVESADSILMNLDEYFRCTIGTIMRHAQLSRGKVDIDQVVGEIVITYESYIHNLRRNSGNSAISLDDLFTYLK